MRVALLTNFIPPYRRPLFQALKERLGEIRIFISTPMESNRQWSVDWADLPVIIQKSITITTHRWRYARFGERSHIHVPVDTLLKLRSYRPDAILTAELGFRTLFAILYKLLYRRTSVIIWLDLAEHSEADVGFFRAILRRTMLSHAKAVLTNGVSASRYARSLGVPEERIFLSAFSVPFEDFASAPVPRPAHCARRLLYAGQFIERKGLFQFLDALQRWCLQNPGRDIEFRLVGSGPLLTALNKLRLPPNLALQIRPEVPYSRMVDEYAEAGIFVLPTFSDTWGMVVSEAMASGMPILGSLYAQAVEHCVEDGKTGWTYTPDNPDLMGAAINRALCSSHETLAQMQMAARAYSQRATVEHSAKVMADAVFSATGIRRASS